MVSVNIEQKIWVPFLKQSIDRGESASERIRKFIQEELTEEVTK